MSDKDKNNKQEMNVFEEEKKILLDHDYDGIKELNHPLPSWWVFVFIATVVFSIPYWIYYHHMSGPSLNDEFNSHMEVVSAAKAEYEKKQGTFNLDEYNSFIADSDALKTGAKVYKRKCKACHGTDGEGGIGPNLTDAYWLNGDGSV